MRGKSTREEVVQGPGPVEGFVWASRVEKEMGGWGWEAERGRRREREGGRRGQNERERDRLATGQGVTSGGQFCAQTARLRFVEGVHSFCGWFSRSVGTMGLLVAQTGPGSLGWAAFLSGCRVEPDLGRKPNQPGF